VRSLSAPGLSLRLTALAAAAASLLAVVSGAFGAGDLHRTLAALALPPLCALVAAGWVAYRRVLPGAAAALVLFLVTAAVTGPRPLHVSLAALAFAAAGAASVASFRGVPISAGPWRDYVALTKPRIMSLLLLTGACGMIGGAHGWPGTSRFVFAMTGLALACGGASALNHLLDADIDRLMGKRTEHRPVAAGRVPPARALEFGLALSAASFVLLAATINLLTAVLALAGNLFYVVVYTRLLKRSTPQNIVIGGAAGAVPPLVGWAAGAGHLGVAAFCLFAIVFFWTPPHFWALALLLREQYAAAKVPMLPVVRGERETVRQILGYTVVLLAASIVPFAIGSFGAIYLGGALMLGGAFLWLAVRLARHTSRRGAALLFHYSLLYLALLFVAAAIDLSV
jgi:protoheme IX farnesyltransferase